jgi:hypothetical protein
MSRYLGRCPRPPTTTLLGPVRDPDDVFAYIDADLTARNRFWPTPGLTALFLAALAVRTGNSRASALADQAMDKLDGNKFWSGAASRVFQQAGQQV